MDPPASASIESPTREMRARRKRSSSTSNLFNKWILVPALSLLFLCIVIWVLNNTAQMSKVIHDDHSSFWVPLDSSKLDEWYNELDVCLLSSPTAALSGGSGGHADMHTPVQSSLRHKGHTSPTYVVVSNRSHADFLLRTNAIKNVEMNWSKNCMKQFQNIGRHHNNNIPSFCRISTCSPSLVAHNFYRKELNGKLTGNFTRKSLGVHLYRLSVAEQALIFIGDSTTKQVGLLALIRLLLLLNVMFTVTITTIHEAKDRTNYLSVNSLLCCACRMLKPYFVK
jgi:hypothetical protein